MKKKKKITDIYIPTLKNVGQLIANKSLYGKGVEVKLLPMVTSEYRLPRNTSR